MGSKAAAAAPAGETSAPPPMPDFSKTSPVAAAIQDLKASVELTRAAPFPRTQCIGAKRGV